MSVRIILSTQDENKLLEVLHSYAGLMQRKYNEIPFEESMNTEARRIKSSQTWAHTLISQINGKFGRCDPLPYLVKIGSWVKNAEFSHDGYVTRVYKCSECHINQFGEKTNYCPNCGAKMKVKGGEENETDN